MFWLMMLPAFAIAVGGSAGLISISVLMTVVLIN